MHGKFKNTSFDAYLHDDGKGVVIVIDFGELYYAPCYFNKEVSDGYFHYLLVCDGSDFRHINWQQDDITLYAKPTKCLAYQHGMAIRNALMLIQGFAFRQILGAMNCLPLIKHYHGCAKGGLIVCY